MAGPTRNRVIRPMLEIDRDLSPLETDAQVEARFQYLCGLPNAQIGFNLELLSQNSAPLDVINAYTLDTEYYNDGFGTPDVFLMDIGFPDDNLEFAAQTSQFKLNISDPVLIREFVNWRTTLYWNQCILWMYFRGEGVIDAPGNGSSDDWFYVLSIMVIDDIQIEDSGQDCTINITAIDDTAYIDTALEWRYTDKDQKAFGGIGASGYLTPIGYTTAEFASDNGFQFVESLQSWNGFWGTQSQSNKTKKPKTTKVLKQGRR